MTKKNYNDLEASERFTIAFVGCGGIMLALGSAFWLIAQLLGPFGVAGGLLGLGVFMAIAMRRGYTYD